MSALFSVGDKVRMIPPERLDSKYNRSGYSIFYRNRTMIVSGIISGTDDHIYYQLRGGSKRIQYAEDFLELANKETNNGTTNT